MKRIKNHQRGLKMTKKNHLHEHFEDVQQKMRIKEEMLYFQVSHRSYREDPIGLDFFSFLLFEKATGTHTIDGVTHQLNDQQLHIIFPGQFHRWDMQADGKIHVLFLSARLFKTFEHLFICPIEYYKRYPVMKLSPRIFKELLHEFTGIDAEFKEERRLNEIAFLKFKIVSLIYNREILEKLGPEAESVHKPIMQRFLLLLQTNIYERKTAQYYANKLGVSANYLNQLCHRHLNKSANAIITRETLKLITYDLVTGKKSIKQLTVDLKFTDLAGFSNYFKRHMGMSPNHYIEQLRIQESEVHISLNYLIKK
ncbi:helix-turn-helix domain-containing protein [Sphingobacterium sp. UBA5670]|uniref:helix-turn-helix domain-containing protein n=1 Tax=Sphingobacterium sp. UBA5670 TaxID=1947502 RepID=UPI0025E42180|nr:helix-turn-helix domain-containing protein [Sphingobacterium sp. UBA5670]